MRVEAGKSSADSSCSSHPAIKSVLTRTLLIKYIHVQVLFCLKLLGIFYSCFDNHQRKREGGGPEDDVLTRTAQEDGPGQHLRSARSDVVRGDAMPRSEDRLCTSVVPS